MISPETVKKSCLVIFPTLPKSFQKNIQRLRKGSNNYQKAFPGDFLTVLKTFCIKNGLPPEPPAPPRCSSRLFWWQKRSKTFKKCSRDCFLSVFLVFFWFLGGIGKINKKRIWRFLTKSWYPRIWLATPLTALDFFCISLDLFGGSIRFRCFLRNRWSIEVDHVESPTVTWEVLEVYLGLECFLCFVMSISLSLSIYISIYIYKISKQL